MEQNETKERNRRSNPSPNFQEHIRNTPPSHSTPPRTEPEDAYPHGLKLVILIGVALMSNFLTSLDATIVSTAVPTIVSQFHQLDDVAWYGSAYRLVMAAFQSQWGKAYKFWPIKYVYFIAILLFEVGSLLCAVAPNSTMLIVGRAISGAGGAGTACGSYVVIAMALPPARRPLGAAFFTVCYLVSSVAGPLVGGAFTSELSWRWCFYINLPIGGTCLALILIFLSAPHFNRASSVSFKEKVLQMDIGAIVLVLGGTISFFLALQWGGVSKPWSSAPVIACMVIAGIFGIAFVLYENMLGEMAAANMRLIRGTTVAFQLSFQSLLAATQFVLLYYLPIYFQVVAGADSLQSGIRLIPLLAASTFAALGFALVLSKTGEYQPLMMMGSIFVAVGSGLLYTLDTNMETGKSIGYQIITGVGFGSLQLGVVVCQNVVQPADLTQVVALALFTQLLGSSIALPIAQALWANKMISSLARDAPNVPAGTIVAAGPEELRNLPPDSLHGVVLSYMAGLKDTFIFALCLSCMAVIVTTASFVFDRHRLKMAK